MKLHHRRGERGTGSGTATGTGTMAMQLQFVHNATLRCCCYLWIIALHWQRDSVCNLCVRCRCPFPLSSPPPPSLLLLALLVVLSTLYVYRHTRPACTVCKCNEQFILSLFLNACGHFEWVLADADDIYMHYRDLYVFALWQPVCRELVWNTSWPGLSIVPLTKDFQLWSRNKKWTELI